MTDPATRGFREQSTIDRAVRTALLALAAQVPETRDLAQAAATPPELCTLRMSLASIQGRVAALLNLTEFTELAAETYEDTADAANPAAEEEGPMIEIYAPARVVAPLLSPPGATSASSENTRSY